MKKKINLLFIALLASAIFVGCTKDDSKWDGIYSEVRIVANLSKADVSASKLANVTIEFVDVNTQMVVKGIFGADGTSITEVPLGVYNISIESEVDDSPEIHVRYCAEYENYAVKNKTEELSVEIKSFPATSNNNGFIISEYFFNGETNSGRMMHPDQYIVIYNSSLSTLYADGLSFATTDQSSAQEKKPYYNETMPEKVATVGFFTIPGTGKDVEVKAGEQIVIAMTAIDHSVVEGYEHAVDLTGADFEFYNQAPDSKDVDNPAVPNLISTNGTWSGFGAYMHPRGFNSAFIFKLEDGKQETITAFHTANTTLYVAPDASEINLTCIPTDMILDGIVTGDRPLVTRPLPESVDRGYFQVSGCHRQELAIRKVIELNGEKYFMDTNDTDVDFEMRKGQSSFPLGWREK